MLHYSSMVVIICFALNILVSLLFNSLIYASLFIHHSHPRQLSIDLIHFHFIFQSVSLSFMLHYSSIVVVVISFAFERVESGDLGQDGGGEGRRP